MSLPNTIPGKLDQLLAVLGDINTDSAVTLYNAIINFKDDIEAIRAKTDDIPDFSDMETAITAVKAKTDNLPADTDTTLSTLQTAITAVKAKTDNLPADTNTTVLAIKAKTDELPADTADTLSTLQTRADAIHSKTNNLPANTTTELTNIGNDLTAVKAKTDELPSIKTLVLEDVDVFDITESEILDIEGLVEIKDIIVKVVDADITETGNITFLYKKDDDSIDLNLATDLDTTDEDSFINIPFDSSVELAPEIGVIKDNKSLIVEDGTINIDSAISDVPNLDVIVNYVPLTEGAEIKEPTT